MLQKYSILIENIEQWWNLTVDIRGFGSDSLNENQSSKHFIIEIKTRTPLKKIYLYRHFFIKYNNISKNIFEKPSTTKFKSNVIISSYKF